MKGIIPHEFLRGNNMTGGQRRDLLAGRSLGNPRQYRNNNAAHVNAPRTTCRGCMGKGGGGGVDGDGRHPRWDGFTLGPPSVAPQ